ncbi:helix-turn-helix transcriptional regulator [Dermacoccus nishinomiyaensis]|uniref:helix-turn-helix domain-containing protein n=1 Tax=Dermacoccus nishinomiyaensis TaxID=1274 RepID=UPI000DF8CB15|nr:helix-turn-helix transcriptional regulator [Dermacoccus nishinomiyaensis]QQY23870.1 helix-turn-helix transcriptional regulator [Dermacoccus nishinomiyaensis]STD11964.1 Uncharacterised protein [Dermacoccus nishinomiyaensis]STD12461.1 Uncharacterised protein [Dermacoccus nishinomiyaensis]
MRKPGDVRARIAIARYDRRLAFARGGRHLPEEPMASLVYLRLLHGMSRADMARDMGVSEAAVTEFETSQADVRMSTVRLYALVVGALVRYDIVKEEA